MLEQLQKKYVPSLLGVSMMDARAAKRPAIAGGFNKLIQRVPTVRFYKWLFSFSALRLELDPTLIESLLDTQHKLLLAAFGDEIHHFGEVSPSGKCSSDWSANSRARSGLPEMNATSTISQRTADGNSLEAETTSRGN